MVQDMQRSAQFYQETLGFEMVEQWTPDGKLSWCKLRRGGTAIMLQLACDEDGDPGSWPNGMSLFVHCEDADAVYAEFVARGADVKPPSVSFYGMKQLFLRDPDGYELCFQNPTQN